MPRIDLILYAVAAAFVAFLWVSRGNALDEVERQTAIIATYKARDALAASDAARKAQNYAEALRKANNEAKAQRTRADWLSRQTGKGCADAQNLVSEYRKRA